MCANDGKMLQYLRKVCISRHRAEVNEDLYFAIKKIEQLDVFNCLPLLSTEFRCAGLTSWTEKRKKKENRGGNSSVEKKSRRFFVGRASAEKQASGADGGTGHVWRVSPRNIAACQKLVRNRVLTNLLKHALRSLGKIISSYRLISEHFPNTMACFHRRQPNHVYSILFPYKPSK